MNSLQDLEQLACHLRFKIKKALYQDNFLDADRYDVELDQVELEIKKLKDGKTTREELIDAIIDLAGDELDSKNDLLVLARASEKELIERLIGIAHYYKLTS